MTLVFYIINSFLYMFIFHVVALHPVYHRSTLSLTSSYPFHSAFYKTIRRRDLLLNTWPSQFFCLCRMVFMKLPFSSTMSKTSWLDRCSVQLIFINILQIHISNDSNRWITSSTSAFLRHTIPYSKSESLLFFSFTPTSPFLLVTLLVYWMLLFPWLFDVLLLHAFGVFCDHT